MTGLDDTVLLVEDDPNDVFFFETAVERLSVAIPVHHVCDGEAAIAWLDAWAGRQAVASSPGALLVVLDLKLPLRGGLDVLQWMRGVPTLATVPVIVLSSSAEPADVERAHALDVVDYNVKPAHFAELVTIVEGIARRWGALERREQG